jgi:hypothetical protein
MAERPEQSVEFGFHSARGLAAFRQRRHHRLSALHHRRVAESFDEPANAKHVAP